MVKDQQTRFFSDEKIDAISGEHVRPAPRHPYGPEPEPYTFGNYGWLRGGRARFYMNQERRRAGECAVCGDSQASRFDHKHFLCEWHRAENERRWREAAASVGGMPVPVPENAAKKKPS